MQLMQMMQQMVMASMAPMMAKVTEVADRQDAFERWASMPPADVDAGEVSAGWRAWWLDDLHGADKGATIVMQDPYNLSTKFRRYMILF
eukprot:COSAG06_NODE_11080_length_1570_cov_11.419443_3_plen_89_part_00